MAVGWLVNSERIDSFNVLGGGGILSQLTRLIYSETGQQESTQNGKSEDIQNLE